MEKKKIVFVLARFLDGGMETVLVEYLRHLSKMQTYELTLAIAYHMGELEVYHDRVPKDVRITYLVHHPWLVKYKKQRPPSRAVKLFDELLINPIRRGIQAYHLHQLTKRADAIVDFDHSQSSFLKSVSIPKIAFFHGSLAGLFEQDPREGKRQQRKIHVYDHIVTISQAMYREACHYFPQAKDKLCMVYNTVDVETLEQLSRATVDDERIKHPFILSVTRLEENAKDVTTLIAAYQILRQQYGHEEELYVIGKGDSLLQLQEKARDCGMEEYVHFLGFMANPFPWVSKCQIFVHSAKSEGLPTNIIEALLLDKMIVATDCPTGPREILNGGKAGILTPVGDKAALAKAMHEALTNKELQERIAEGRKQHRPNFVFETAGKVFCKLLESK